MAGLADLGRAAPALNRNWQNIMEENSTRRQEAMQGEELAMKREQFGQQQAIGKLQLEREQMAIDADLNAGLIGEDEARRRRTEISQESEFYGAMDGASKYVRGDAIAGILVIIINIVGGLIVS